MRRISLLILLASLLGLGGCATDAEVSTEHAAGSLPWNRPESWEGTGMMGAAMQGTP
jgi:hypothetical protein